MMRKFWAKASVFGMTALVCAVGATAQGSSNPVKLEVDLREAPKRIFHAKMEFPVKPGPFALVYPKWLPGDHAPTGPIVDLTGVKFFANGKEVQWRRNTVDLYAFECVVPEGAKTLEATLDYLSPSEPVAAGVPAATAQLAMLSWNMVLLYPRDTKSDEVNFSAKLRIPAGWKYATALHTMKESNEGIEFETVSLTTLVDSPVLTGAHMNTYDLSPGKNPAHRLNTAADSATMAEAPPEQITVLRQLVAETGALFGGRHYRKYDFLLALTDHMQPNGLEHHESSDNRLPERTLHDPDLMETQMDLLPHEFFHSWNGKYRRPAGLATPDYDEPMKDELLWVYEGLTDYYGAVLAARIGLFSPEDFRDYLASIVSQMEATTGRNWRPLADTAIAAPVLYAAPQEWGTARRGTDFYPEMDLIWLEADTIIRRQTNGQRSLDDFCRLFHGGESTPPMVKPYTEDDVVSALNTVAPYDWRGFFDSRIYKINPHAPLGGIEGSGWKMVYTETPNALIQANEQSGRGADFTDTLGLLIGGNGAISDIIAGRPADKAGMSPGQLITAVSGRKYSADLLHAAVKASRSNTAPIELLVQDG